MSDAVHPFDWRWLSRACWCDGNALSHFRPPLLHVCRYLHGQARYLAPPTSNSTGIIVLIVLVSVVIVGPADIARGSFLL
eukprot:SAG25_NODE_316_length_9962_cov_5.659637_5_plen_80_part_00